MHNYRFKRQTSRIGVFAGVTADALRQTTPPVRADHISDRVWLDTSRVSDGFRGTSLQLSRNEVGWLRTGLRHVADDITRAEATGHIIVVIHALEIVEVDYLEAALAPAIAGWAALEFGFTNRPAEIRLDGQTNEYVVCWTG
ncbi:hypothetical protein [Actinoplanes regularis]|uniref:hypothetical protein n=1 Tax=Actinoplanes regularis TaxID=52697 RepID=UPI0024A4727B|nr:hypothetical protein [Actinoplanes regularis]GLW30448.1 hypothetical protein Areg01_33880 [Actinoplanes regularis]